MNAAGLIKIDSISRIHVMVTLFNFSEHICKLSRSICLYIIKIGYDLFSVNVFYSYTWQLSVRIENREHTSLSSLVSRCLAGLTNTLFWQQSGDLQLN